ncbi:MAG: PH domain-containing protein [bacterium]|nr:PH domain-containing protein [bacterium]
MGYIDRNLVAGEHVVFRTKLHWIIYTKSIILLILAILVYLLGMFYPIVEDIRRFYYIIASVLIFLSVILFIPAWLKYISSEFGVTTSRVLIKVGFISRNSFELLISKIEGIGVDQSILGRILNYGTIIVSGTGGTKESFALIAKPLEFRKKVQEQIISLQTLK